MNPIADWTCINRHDAQTITTPSVLAESAHVPGILGQQGLALRQAVGGLSTSIDNEVGVINGSSQGSQQVEDVRIVVP